MSGRRWNDERTASDRAVIRVDEADETLQPERVLREWVEREARKDGYPDADPSGWGRERLRRELAETYDEPVEPACRDSPAWTRLVVDGAHVGKFAPFPGPGWDALSDGGAVADAVDRLRDDDLADDFPDATAAIDALRAGYPDREFGALVARQFDGEWPPVFLEGNHRACAAHWCSREGVTVALEVHLAHDRPLADLPVAVTPGRG